MSIASVRPWLPAIVAAFILGGAVPHTAAASVPGYAGYVLINELSEGYSASQGGVELSGTITNYCAASLPAKSEFVFEFDSVEFAGFQVTALNYGDTQNFTAFGSISNPAAKTSPKNNTTTLGFTIQVPKKQFEFGPDQKTSPCIVVLQQP